MHRFDIYTKIRYKADVDHLMMLVTSFVMVHKESAGTVYVLVDGVKDLPEHPNIQYVDSLPDKYLFVSCRNVFYNTLHSIVAYHRNTNWESYCVAEDADDFYCVNNDSEMYERLGPDFVANFNITRDGDRSTYYNCISLMENAVSINTKDFAPAERGKINSKYTLIFPWEWYFQVVNSAEDYVSDRFRTAVVENCQKFVHGVYYRLSGILKL
ncbi:hypothetical protein VPHD479_0264 [Vibrio phage D479]